MKLKTVTKGIVRDYQRELRRRKNKEESFSDLPDIVIENLAFYDTYGSDYTSFEVCGVEICVVDGDLAKVMPGLSGTERRILLLSI